MKMRFLATFLGRTSGAEAGTESPSGRHRASTGRRVRPSAGFGALAAVAARAGLGDDAFATARAEGRAMTLEQAVAYALEEQPSA